MPRALEIRTHGKDATGNLRFLIHWPHSHDRGDTWVSENEIEPEAVAVVTDYCMAHGLEVRHLGEVLSDPTLSDGLLHSQGDQRGRVSLSYSPEWFRLSEESAEGNPEDQDEREGVHRDSPGVEEVNALVDV